MQAQPYRRNTKRRASAALTAMRRGKPLGGKQRRARNRYGTSRRRRRRPAAAAIQAALKHRD